MNRNGQRHPSRPRRQRHPSRPRIELSGGPASPEEAAAITGAIEQFMRDTAPPPAAPGPALNPWLRAGLLEATGRGTGALGPWGDSPPWGS